MLEWLFQEKIALEKKQVVFSRNKPEQNKLKVERDRKEMAVSPWEKD